MANILVPERYSHDILRGDIEALDVHIQLMRLASRKEDLDDMKFLTEELHCKLDQFKKHFEEHDAEMQFVDKLVEEHKHEQMVNDNWKKKWNNLSKIGAVVAVISAIVSLYFMFH